MKQSTLGQMLANSTAVLADGSAVTKQHMANAGLLGPLERKEVGDPPALSPEMKAVSDALNTGIKSLREKYEALEKGMVTEGDFKAFSVKLNAHLDETERKLTEQLRAARGTGEDKPTDAKLIDLGLEFATAVEGKKGYFRHNVDTEMVKKAQTYRNEFETFMRNGIEGPALLQGKALSSGNDAYGGFWVPTTLSARIVQKQFEFTPMMELATVEMISGDSLDIAADRQTVPAVWVDDTSPHTSGATEQIGMKKIMSHNLQRSIKASQNFIDDANRDVEAWAADKAGLSFALATGTALINGNGVGKPRGLMTYTPVAWTKAADLSGSTWGQMSFVPLGNVAGLLPNLDGLLNLISSLKGVYRPNATYMMERYSLGTVRVLKDTQGHYLLDYSATNRGIANVFGFPIREGDDMDVIAAGVFPVVFGDIRAAYTVAQRRTIRTLRDPFSSKPMVELDFTTRLGGDVVDFDAFRAGKVA